VSRCSLSTAVGPSYVSSRTTGRMTQYLRRAWTRPQLPQTNRASRRGRLGGPWLSAALLARPLMLHTHAWV
jgi:hypothetical protein